CCQPTQSTTRGAKPRHSFFDGYRGGSLSNTVSFGAVVKAGDEIARPALAATLGICLNAGEGIAVLPVVASFNTTNRAGHMNGVRAVYAEIGTKTGRTATMRPSDTGCKIIYIGAGSPPTVTNVAAHVPTGPAIDRRGRWRWRRFDRHVSRKGKPARGK